MEYRWALLLLSFLPFLLLQELGLLTVWSLGEAAQRKEVFGIIGSSVLLDPEYEGNLSNIDVLWTFNKSNKSPVNILDYAPTHKGHQIVEPNDQFRLRLQFSTSNGSLKLNNLKPIDRGTYTITVSTSWQWSVDLELLEPLSRPVIFSNSNYVDTTIEWICQVSSGRASSVLWWKDGKVITSGRRYQIVQNNSTLIISKAIKSDGGNYTCTVENPVSKNQSSYLYIVYGLPHQHYYTLGFSIVSLITLIALFLIMRMNSLLQEMKGPRLLENIFRILQLFSMLPSVLLMCCIVCWIQVEGADGIAWFTLVLLVLVLLLLMVTKYCPKTGSVVLNVFAIFHDTVVTSVSAILIVETLKRAGKGCEPAARLPQYLILAAVVPFILMLSFLAYYFMCGKRNQRTIENDNFELGEQSSKSVNSLSIVSNEEQLKSLTTQSSEET